MCVSANTTSIINPMDKEVILPSKYYYFGNVFFKTVVVVDSDSPVDLCKINQLSGKYLSRYVL